MLTFLFWNMGGEPTKDTPPDKARRRQTRLCNALAGLVHQHRVDLLMLAEWPVEQDRLLAAINQPEPTAYKPSDPESLCARILIFPRFSARYLVRRGGDESRWFTLRHVRLPAREPFILFVAHFGSKLYKREPSQTSSMPPVARLIRAAEARARPQHQRTIVVGDLNMNPFDPGMVTAEGMNAVMTKELALRRTRTVDAEPYPFFYNPMWSLFGDSTHEDVPPGHPKHEPPGTCYFQSRESWWYYWHIFDQVLLRPDLVPHFSNKDLKILVTDGEHSFLDAKGLPNRVEFSDHRRSCSGSTSD